MAESVHDAVSWWRRTSKTVPWPLWFLGLLVVVGVALRAVIMPAVIAAVIAIAGTWQAWSRRRVERARQVLTASGGGVWTGWLGIECLEWLCPQVPIGARTSLLYPDRAPVLVTADLSGLTIAVRGPIAAALWRRQSVLIPWTDIAGARSRDRGRGFGDGSVSLLRLTDVTVDIVGASAQDWADLWDLADEAALVLITTSPGGLVETISARGVGPARLTGRSGPAWRGPA